MSENIDIMAFADRYLSPYRIKTKFDGEEIVPERCPICGGGDNGDKYTFALSITRGCYVCKRGSCAANGRIEELMRFLGEDPGNRRYNGRGTMNQSPRYQAPKTVLQPMTQTAYDFLAARGISRKTADFYRLATDENGNLVFPFYQDTVLTYVKHRKPKADLSEKETKFKEWQDPGTKPILFGMDNCLFSQPLYITEGEMDCLSLYEAGIENAVSVPCGCDNMLWIETCFDWLEKFQTIILFGDSDDPGRRMVDEVARRLDESRCRIVRDYPEGIFGNTLKDANEILMELGADAVRQTAESAEEIAIEGMIDVGDIPPYDPTDVNRIAFGIPTLDEMLGGMEEGCITIISGRSGDGKSTITNQFVLNAVEQGRKVAIYSGELKAAKLIYWLSLQAAGSDYVGLKFDKIKGKDVPAVSWDVQRRVKDWLAGNVFLFDNEQNRPQGENEIDTVLRLFTMIARRNSPFLFVVDNVMSLVADQNEENAAQRAMIVKLKSFAQRFKCHIILIAHPRKSGTKEQEVISKDSVAGSSSMVNFCDSAFSVERPNIRILKNRDGGCSRLIECCYMSDCRRIYQADKGDCFRKYSWDRIGCDVPKVKANTIYGITMAESQPF